LSTTTVSSWRSTPSLAPATASTDAGRDMLVRNWYDADGRPAGTLDGDNHLTVYTYDGAGELTQKTSYANAVSWNASLASVVITHDAVHDQTTRYIYDGRGSLVYSINNNLIVTEYDYYFYSPNLVATITYGAPIGSTTTYTAAYVAAQI